MTQSTRLFMIGQGNLGDSPAVTIQPTPVRDGNHLRWGFRREMGFPWYGYFLFRRPSKDARLACMSISERRLGSTGTSALSLPIGTFTGSQAIVLRDDFSALGLAEIDLAQQAELTWSPPPTVQAYQVQLSIGFRSPRQAIRCFDLADTRLVGRVVHGHGFSIEPGAGGPDLIRGAALMDRVERSELGSREARIPVGRGATIRLDEPVDEITISFFHRGDTSVSAVGLDSEGREVAGRTGGTTASGGSTEVTLRGSERIAAVRLEIPSPIIIDRICIGGPARAMQRVSVVAALGAVPVAAQTIQGRPGEVVPIVLSGPGIDSVTCTPAGGATSVEASVVELCYASAATSADDNWEPCPDAPEPITLPLFHPDYPATGGSPIDLNASEALAIGRILYGTPSDYAGAPFKSMHQSLIDLVSGGPGGPPMADASRATSIPGVSSAPSSGPAPNMSAVHPLDLLLLAAVSPAAAQVLGMYWVDQTAQPGLAYDYLIIADTVGSASGKAASALSQWSAGALGYEAYAVFGLTPSPAPPLDPPTGSRAYAMPLGTVYAPDGPDQPQAPAAGLVGLRWDLPTSGGVLLPSGPVGYHVRREALGNNTAPLPSSGLGDWITKRGPILVGQFSSSGFANPQWPPDWPSEPLYRVDLVETQGWYGYQVSSMDLFGHISAPSQPAPWHQWAPTPNPKPWYYLDPPADRVVHPSAVRILDKTPPPSPLGLQASLLDPLDPFLVKDTPYLTWRSSLPGPSGPDLIGLRASWYWRSDQMRQAPDTAEFRLYFNPGTNPPTPDSRVAASWHERIHVVPYANATSVTPDGSERFYEVFLPTPTGTVFASGVPLSTPLATPIAYAHVGVSAADASPHTADDPSWASGAWGNRPGNEGQLSAPAKVFLVRREQPPAPGVPAADSDRVFASPADYHSASYYTFRWKAAPSLRTHVYRALDESVFAADLAQRPRPNLTASDLAYFPDAALEPRWDAATRAAVATELNALNALAGSSVASAMATYRTLSNDGLRILAGLSGNERAFSQITLKPLDASDPANADRPGPDNPASFPVNSALRAFIDRLDGRGTNRYFYRASYVDGANNQSELSLSGPPVWLPNVVPPRAPAVTKVIGGDREITLKWASNREPDLAEYRVYRAASVEDARDVRAMTLVHTEPVASGSPTSRPAEVAWADGTVPSGRDVYYRVTARDTATNESDPTPVLVARAYRIGAPDAPFSVSATRLTAGGNSSVQLTWQLAEDLEVLVQRRNSGWPTWAGIGNWLPAGTTAFDDPGAALSVAYEYRLKARDSSGRQSRPSETMTVPHVP